MAFNQAGCTPVKLGIPAVRHEPHPDHPASLATYVTADGRELPLWTDADIDFSYEIICDLRERNELVTAA